MASRSCVWALYIFFAIFWGLLGDKAAEAICPTKCTCDDESLVVKCESASLDIVPITLNPGIRQLFLSNNNIKAIVASFSFYKDLETLNLSHNRLTTLEPKCFKSQIRLRKLVLGQNQLANLTSGEVFSGLRALRVLRLEDNDLEEVSDRLFIHLKNLEELDLSGNRINVIRAEAFTNLENLRVLRLGNNRLNRVPSPETLAPLKSLLVLSLRANPLLSLMEPSAFGTLPTLSHLDLEGCRLRDVGMGDAVGVLKGLRNLTVLRLGDNALTNLPSTSEWSHLPRLQELSVSRNPFDEIPSGAFANLRSLRVLEINRCPKLRSVRARAFDGCPSLSDLALNDNIQLSYVEANAFDGLPKLRYVGLRGNSLAHLAVDVFPSSAPIGQLEVLDVRENPLECNCSVLWLRDWQRERNTSSTLLNNNNNNFATVVEVSSTLFNVSVSIAEMVDVQCLTPESLRHKTLFYLGEDQLGCFSAQAATQQKVVLGVTSVAVIVCVIVIVFLANKYRQRVTRVLKDKWTERPLRAKDVHYEKTNDDEENTILQVAAQQSLKMTPVTEL